MESTRIEERRQYVVENQEYLFELTLKEIGLKNI